MVFDHNNRNGFPWDRPRKLKHLALKSVYYRLLNTSYIFTYNSVLYCRCNEFQGCSTKPVNGLIADRNYCYVCHVKVTYDEEKIKSLKKIAFVCNNFLEIKEDIELCIDFDPSCKDFWMYHYRKTLVTGFGKFKWQYLYSWIHHYIYNLCWNDQ